MSILPWSKKPGTALVPAVGTTTELSTTEPKVNNDIVIHRGSPLANKSQGSLVQVRSRELMIGGKKVKVDPHQLIRLIKRVTQNIGEYKGLEDIYSTIVCGALRKARGDLVNILETEFHIHWNIDKESGESVFYM